jgi:hypothetical protein
MDKRMKRGPETQLRGGIARSQFGETAERCF